MFRDGHRHRLAFDAVGICPCPKTTVSLEDRHWLHPIWQIADDVNPAFGIVAQLKELTTQRRDGTFGSVTVSAGSVVDGKAAFDMPSSVGADQFDGDRRTQVVE